jgi:mRNA-degrading endonuclease toxin of MazEF toxin-antitoxin module
VRTSFKRKEGGCWAISLPPLFIPCGFADVIFITSSIRLQLSPTYVLIVEGAPSGLHATSVALLEQIRTVDRTRLLKPIGRLDPKAIAQHAEAEAIAVTLGLKRL